MTVIEARAEAERILRGGRIPAEDDPSRDALVLLAWATGRSRSRLLAHPEEDVPEPEKFLSLARKRATGLPVAYVTGEKEFWGMTFQVTPDVLIPKPDTETLVERAIEVLRAHAAGSPESRRFFGARRFCEALDVCTGSGCVAVAIARSVPESLVTATDISEAALRVAEENARELGPSDRPIRFVLGDLRDGLPPPSTPDSPGYALIVSNPPYVPSDVARGLLEDGRGEPLLALDGGADGLDLVRALAPHALRALAPGGTFLVEVGEYNAAAAAGCLKEEGFLDIVTHRDLAGLDRVVEGRRG
ncbi:MAG TPA: peptide chain release factor N(5)-glutamine methyltransferase [Treponemataceae bacterium]|nr:peptide chain release factor N(5)-glutamine methyltransferase [Treponemataceae bacterium]